MRRFQIKIWFHILTVLVSLTSTGFLPISAYSAEPVRIGILAFRSKQQILDQWQPLATALKQAIPEHDFVVDVLTYPEFEAAIAKDALDFVLTNPAHYILLTKRSGLSAPLATLATIENNQPTIVFGGIIFTRAQQSDINVLSDIKNKTIAATNTDSFGGYQMQSYALKHAGVNLSQDAKIIITGMPHDNVVEAVLNKSADVGFVRTGLIESMAREGKLDLKKIKIINLQNMPSFPVQTSTELYPEWAFASMPHTDENLARHVASALFLLEENSAATLAMNIHGFVVPADYTPVADVLKELRVEPFDVAPPFTINDVWERYRFSLIVSLVALGLIVILSIRLLWIKRKLNEEHLVVLKQKEQSRERELHLNTLLESTSECVKVVSNNGTLLSMNSAGLSLIEASSEEVVIDQSVYQIVAPEHRTAFQAFNEAICGGKTGSLEFEIIGLNGTRKWMSSWAVPFKIKKNDEVTQLAFTREITEHKRLEQEKEHYQKFFKLSMDPMCIANQSGCFMKVNPAFVKLLGFTESELINKPFFDFIFPDDRQRTILEMEEQVTKRRTVKFENRYICKNGDIKLLSWTGYYDRNEGVTYATAHDITFQRQSEAELRIAAIAFESQEGIFVTDSNSIIIRANRAFTTITGYQSEEAIGHTPRLFFSGQHDASFYADMWQDINIKGHWAGEIWNRRKNGEIYPEYLTITAVTDTNGYVSNYVAALIDISESKKREQQRLIDEELLRRTLVREVHHRIKNNLHGVISLLSHFVTKTPDLASAVGEAIGQMQSISVIHGLQCSSTRMNIKLYELVSSVAANCQSLWRSSITVDNSFLIDSCIVAEQEAVNISLVLNELFSNAIKHGDTSKQINVRFEYSASPYQVQVIIANTGQLSNDADLSKTDIMSPANGTGLELVTSLLGKSGSVVTWEQCGDIVVTKLELNPPVITLNSE